MLLETDAVKVDLNGEHRSAAFPTGQGNPHTSRHQKPSRYFRPSQHPIERQLLRAHDFPSPLLAMHTSSTSAASIIPSNAGDRAAFGLAARGLAEADVGPLLVFLAAALLDMV